MFALPVDGIRCTLVTTNTLIHSVSVCTPGASPAQGEATTEWRKEVVKQSRLKSFALLLQLTAPCARNKVLP